MKHTPNDGHAHDWVEDDIEVYCQLCGEPQAVPEPRSTLADRVMVEINYYIDEQHDQDNRPQYIDIVTKTLSILTEWQLLGDDIN